MSAPAPHDPPTAAAPPREDAATSSARGALRRMLVGLLVSLGLSVAAVVLIARFVPDFTESQRVDLRADQLAIAFGLMVAMWIVDALRYRWLARGMDLEIGLGRGLELSFLFHTAVFLTPGSSGGQPALIWYLLRRGVPGDKAGAIAICKPVLAISITTAAAAVALLTVPELPPGLSTLLWPVFGVFAALATLLGLLLVFPAGTARGLVTVLAPLRVIPRIGRPFRDGRAVDAIERTSRTIADLRRQGPVFLLANLFITLVWYAIGLALMAIVVTAVGGEQGVTATLMGQLAIFRAIAIFSPTPGAAGIAEGGIFWFFRAEHAVAIMAAYRVFFFYIEIAIGLILIVRELLRSPASPPGSEPETSNA